MPTLPDVFIIESLDPDDEGNGRMEGMAISHILRLHGKSPIYRYVRTREDFEKAIREFADSKYRYLHISAHADPEGLCTTNLDPVDFDELAEMLVPHFDGKRLFLSACSMVHADLAKEIFPKCNCISVIGPRTDISFQNAVIVWSSIYHLMFTADHAAMKKRDLTKNLLKVSEIFDVHLAYFSKSETATRKFREVVIN